MARSRGLLALCLIALMAAAIGGWWSAAALQDETPAAGPPSGPAADERVTGYYSILDEAGNVLLTTGIEVTVGDRFIAEDNREYEVYAIEGDTARARLESGVAGLAPLQPSPGERFQAWVETTWATLSGLYGRAPRRSSGTASAASGATIAIYHTHSDESYVPSDGAANIPAHGGVFQVGATFKNALEAGGMKAVESTQTHDPHDNLAYDRSRRTALSLLARYRPAAIFDVHRDTAPRQAYQRQVSGKQVTQVMFVIGRQNPNMRANLAFAQKLKAAVDKTHPGLVRAIYFGQGRYNQDLSPRALLIEAGAQDNTKADAERGVALLADDVPKVVGTAGPTGSLGLGGENGGAARAMITIVAGILILAAGYLVIASGGFSQAWDRLRRLRSTELAGYINRREVPRMGPDDKRELGKGGDEVWMTTGRNEGAKEREEETKDSTRTGGHRDRKVRADEKEDRDRR